MIIAVPSKGRAGATKTDRILGGNCVFYVPESETHQYSYIENVVGVPISVSGITETRNWILKNCNDSRVVFVDDDVKSAGWIKIGKSNVKNISEKNGSFWYNEFEKIFNLCEQLEYKIFGLKTEASTRSTYPYKPILLKTYVTASCMGIVNDGEFYFDETFKVKEDYELCLRHIKKYGGILGIRYLHWENSHWGDEGGCADYRTHSMELDAIKRLVKMYPNMIKSAKRENSQYTVSLNL